MHNIITMLLFYFDWLLSTSKEAFLHYFDWLISTSEEAQVCYDIIQCYSNDATKLQIRKIEECQSTMRVREVILYLSTIWSVVTITMLCLGMESEPSY